MVLARYWDTSKCGFGHPLHSIKFRKMKNNKIPSPTLESSREFASSRVMKCLNVEHYSFFLCCYKHLLCCFVVVICCYWNKMILRSLWGIRLNNLESNWMLCFVEDSCFMCHLFIPRICKRRSILPLIFLVTWFAAKALT